MFQSILPCRVDCPLPKEKSELLDEKTSKVLLPEISMPIQFFGTEFFLPHAPLQICQCNRLNCTMLALEAIFQQIVETSNLTLLFL